ncbi:hypothetical protein GCM10022226_71010 [Sphaerisporangium flaviroseum]|uniref:Uncharacterized protein n=1 Tax=Sphaerisporangium flaviroseum TaxID=509199 RepID=A0ABP7JB46_9ACTN
MATVGDGDGKKSRWPRILVPALIGTAVVLIASAIGLSATTKANSPSAAPSASSAPQSSCERLASRVQVRQVSGAIVFPDVSYSVEDAGDRPRVDLAGSFQGVIEEGKRVVVIVQADPGSYDSTPGHHPGDGRYYYEQELRVDEQTHCWSALSLTPAYSGSRGLAWHIYLVLVPADFSVTSVSARNQVEDGLFKSLHILALFTVNT